MRGLGHEPPLKVTPPLLLSCKSTKTLDTSNSVPSPLSSKSTTMSSPDPQVPDPQSSDLPPPPDAESAGAHQVEGEDEDGEEEEGECGFCLFMKGGGCKDKFIDWEKCIEEAEKNKEDVVEKCFQATAALKKCMEAHSDYYEPILRAEKAAEEEAVRELEEEAAAKDSETRAKSKERVEVLEVPGNQSPGNQR